VQILLTVLKNVDIYYQRLLPFVIIFVNCNKPNVYVIFDDVWYLYGYGKADSISENRCF